MNVKCLAIALLLLAPECAPASERHAKGPNGGTVKDAGSYHVELIAKSNTVELFVSDKNDKPIESTGFKAVAILIVDGKAQRIPLEPAGQTRLSGTAAISLPVQPKGVVQLTTPDGKTAQAKFD